MVALEQLPGELQAPFLALWNLDLALADVVATSSDPRLGAVRLAWWRERLEQLDEAKAAPGEPRLRAVEGALLVRGVSGGELSNLEDAWLPLLDPFPWADRQIEGLRLRGRILFGTGSRLLGGDPQLAQPAGELWSLIDGALHCSDPRSRTALLDAAGTVDSSNVIPAALRPITTLTALSITSVRKPGSGLARGLSAVRHRLTGRLPPL